MPPERGGPAERERLQFVPALLYGPWLLLQIVTSAVYVTRLILGPIEKVDPRIFAFRSDQPNEVAAVTLGNSITLTPGTLTLDIDDDVYWIHALDARSEVFLPGPRLEGWSRVGDAEYRREKNATSLDGLPALRGS